MKSNIAWMLDNVMDYFGVFMLSNEGLTGKHFYHFPMRSVKCIYLRDKYNLRTHIPFLIGSEMWL